MTARYSGAFDGLTNWPPDHSGQGWSNVMTAAATTHARFGDGDFMSAPTWMEAYGNVNFELAQGRRLLWHDSFIGTGSADTDPESASGGAPYENSGNSFDSVISVYGISDSKLLLPNPRRGADRPCRMTVRVSARRTGGTDSHFIRVYAVPGPWVLADWGDLGSVCPYVEWELVDGVTAYPSTEGWCDSPDEEQELDLSPANAPWGWEWKDESHLEVTAGEGVIPVRFMSCCFVVAAIGDGGEGPLVRAVSIWEEEPAV